MPYRPGHGRRARAHGKGARRGHLRPLASAAGAAPAWDRVAGTCTTYCHGATLNAGGTLHAPVWTQVDGTQAACGTCHGIPPPAPHVQSTDCGNCHAGYTATSVNLATHLDGQVQSNGRSGTSCHGSSANAAPPTGTHGETATTALAVGAHQSHLAGGALRGAIACGECHVVPASSANHPTGTLNVTFGALATAGGAAPAFDAAGGTCSGVYCHGATLGAGGTLQQPLWTKVDGTQAACGTCHGIPPPAPHVQSAACGSCHAGYTATTVNAATHIDGALQATGATCTSCHGQSGQSATAASPLAAAPPVDTTGASTGLRVGAHQRHLTAGPYANALPCQTCHASVASYTTSHANGTADVGFSGAGAGLTGGTYTPRSGSVAGSCSGTACHAVADRNGTSSGGTLPAPAWSGSITACTACHGAPPPTGHHSTHSGRSCGDCHGGYTTSAVNPALHVNGARDVGGTGTSINSWTASTRSCQPSCHGTQTW